MAWWVVLKRLIQRSRSFKNSQPVGQASLLVTLGKDANLPKNITSYNVPAKKFKGRQFLVGHAASLVYSNTIKRYYWTREAACPTYTISIILLCIKYHAG